MSKKQFCSVCGKQKIPDPNGYFDTETGKRKDFMCPSGICNHDGVGCDTVPARGFIAWMSGNHVTCRRCGKTYGEYSGCD